jgi:multidrug transporter EmrE-like cation transporter
MVRLERVMDHLYIFGTILFTVYGQLVIKWQVARAGAFPVEVTEKIWVLFRLVLNPWVISSLAGAFLAFLCWVAAMTRFELGYAYPFTSLAFVLVLVLSAVLFHEAITVPKALGVAFILIGIIVGSQG